ncbi:Uncharacterised protein [Clostridium putrefaciens]|uniref:Uncharacterized protein n=1 Tax=Clostridium putrefaciens TaxID=99675 RepID=A0A381JCL6_9CLOT|nr:hypothetical protein [Clostridium putrefaciens]SUY48147.1 Uncharacterised protein [Clostridium putrefaciens]
MNWINEPKNISIQNGGKAPCPWVLAIIGLCTTGPLCGKLCFIHSDN